MISVGLLRRAQIFCFGGIIPKDYFLNITAGSLVQSEKVNNLKETEETSNEIEFCCPNSLASLAEVS